MDDVFFYGIEPVNKEKPAHLRNILLVGNSFMFYNCGVTGMMNGFAQSKTDSFTSDDGWNWRGKSVLA